MEEGFVKVWFANKGYGFIGRPGQQDIFFHFSMISGTWEPRKGDKVAFDVETDDMGRLRAKDVQLIPYQSEP